MIETVETRELHCCDLCKRRIRSTSIKKCICCNKELCSYCRLSLSRIQRKHPDNGYLLVQRGYGSICINCARSKLKMEIKDLKYP